jgi:hypothetical protein
MKNENEILESLKCPICIDYANEPIECQLCNNIFCTLCLYKEDKLMYKSCPMCRKEPNFKESQFAKRLLNNIPIDCPNKCEITVSRIDIKTHLLKCENRPYECKICKFTDKKEEFFLHIIKEHKNTIISEYSIQALKETQTNDMDDGIRKVSTNPLVEPNQSSLLNLKNNINRKGNKVLIGTNSLFYCGKPSDIPCNCCDGNCGPDNGCLCKSCMEFNAQYYCLPKGHLFNSDGISCQPTLNGFYCHREYQTKITSIIDKLFNKSKKCKYPNQQCEACLKVSRFLKEYTNH